MPRDCEGRCGVAAMDEAVTEDNNRTIVYMKSVTKWFPGVKALDGVDFSASAGQIHALVGENGAGKSTLIKVLGGVFAPDNIRPCRLGKDVGVPFVRHFRCKKGQGYLCGHRGGIFA